MEIVVPLGAFLQISACTLSQARPTIGEIPQQDSAEPTPTGLGGRGPTKSGWSVCNLAGEEADLVSARRRGDLGVTHYGTDHLRVSATLENPLPEDW
jgi:hypothetical protein